MLFLRKGPTRFRALLSVSMALGGRMGETRTNLKKGSAAERLTDYLNYILGTENKSFCLLLYATFGSNLSFVSLGFFSREDWMICFCQQFRI